MMEPPTSLYRFEVINNTKTSIVIENELRDYKGLNSDTIREYQEFNKLIPRRGRYQDYNDTLIQSFFIKLSIKSLDNKKVINPFRRVFWSDSLDLTRIHHYNGDYAKYTFVIQESDLQ